ncbi:hypothetical protein [Ruania rhizosphaerae]|uniref:hypothetical protein n=1 Tax=Ruania rhizosphaerae TaxID=1840413 RepID=UPI00135C950D|nr:hypothetical protein [Ruania rhizosphaerae]
MTVEELIEKLQECDPGAEVLLAHQPNWPLQFQVGGVASGEDIAGETECDEHHDYNCDECAEPVVYLVDGDHPGHPYAPRAAWTVAR